MLKILFFKHLTGWIWASYLLAKVYFFSLIFNPIDDEVFKVVLVNSSFLLEHYPSSPHVLYLQRTSGNKASLASDQKGILARDSLVCIKTASLV